MKNILALILFFGLLNNQSVAAASSCSLIGGGGGSGGITSINSDTTAAQTIVGSHGITVSTTSGVTTVTKSETSFTLPNNSSATNLTGATCDSATYRSCVFNFDIYRKTDTASSEVRSVGSITFIWSLQDSAWYAMSPVFVGDDRSVITNVSTPSGVTFSVSGTTTLQVQVATDNIPGANYVGKLNWTKETFNL